MLPAPLLLGPLPVASLHPAAPASPPHGSVLPWLLAAIVLAIVVASGVYLSSRH